MYRYHTYEAPVKIAQIYARSSLPKQSFYMWSKGTKIKTELSSTVNCVYSITRTRLYDFVCCTRYESCDTTYRETSADYPCIGYNTWYFYIWSICQVSYHIILYVQLCTTLVIVRQHVEYRNELFNTWYLVYIWDCVPQQQKRRYSNRRGGTAAESDWWYTGIYQVFMVLILLRVYI